MKEEKKMRKQILKATVLALATAGMSLAEVHVPSKGASWATIPFEFTVGERTLRAGDYVIEPDGDKLRICEDGIRCTTVEAARIELEGLTRGATLVFERSGREWTLVQAWTGPQAGYRVMRGGPDFDATWKTSEFFEVEAKTLCVHRIAGLPPSWH
jgi:hypothetical protein